MTNDEPTLNPSALLEIDDNYVFASWMTRDNQQVIAVYRDYANNGSWALEQFRGPFSHVIDGAVTNNPAHELYPKSAMLAIDMHTDLNRSLQEVKSSWEGVLYDR